jgi:NAD(P)-dependent dehydrogenase (short-subunit alcohol dehydrogenase family)
MLRSSPMPGRALFTLEGKTALVTGGARGVGYMCAQALLDHGAAVIITSRRAEVGAEACRELSEHGSCELITADLSSEGGIRLLGEALRERLAALDIVVNNAGITWGAPFEEYPAQAWTKVLQLDVATPFQVVQATADLLKAAARAGDPSRVVNMGSVDGHAVSHFENFAYPPSKAALHHLTRLLALRLASDNITVNCIAPGPLVTKMTAGLLAENPEVANANPLGRLAEPDDIAGALIYLAARAGSYVTGAVIPVDGGFAIPTWASSS